MTLATSVTAEIQSLCWMIVCLNWVNQPELETHRHFYEKTGYEKHAALNKSLPPSEVCDGAGSVNYEGLSKRQKQSTWIQTKIHIWRRGYFIQMETNQPHFRAMRASTQCEWVSSSRSWDRRTSLLPGMTNYYWNRAGLLPWPANKH